MELYPTMSVFIKALVNEFLNEIDEMIERKFKFNPKLKIVTHVGDVVKFISFKLNLKDANEVMKWYKKYYKLSSSINLYNAIKQFARRIRENYKDYLRYIKTKSYDPFSFWINKFDDALEFAKMIAEYWHKLMKVNYEENAVDYYPPKYIYISLPLGYIIIRRISKGNMVSIGLRVFEDKDEPCFIILYHPINFLLPFNDLHLILNISRTRERAPIFKYGGTPFINFVKPKVSSKPFFQKDNFKINVYLYSWFNALIMMFGNHFKLLDGPYECYEQLENI